MFKFIAILLFLNALNSFEASVICPTGSVPALNDNTLCYSFLSSSTEYLNAEQLCVDLGGHLASIDSAFTDTFLNQKAETSFKNTNASDFWVGANDLSSSGVWTWTDGKPFTFTDWAQGEPSNDAGSDCVGVQLANGLWAAQNCYQRKPFICAIPGTEAKTCPLYCPSEWSFFNLTSSCYKVFFDSKWDDAEATCVSQGAHLTSVHSDAENVYVANLAHTTLKVSTPDQCWIGLYTEDKNRSWKWTDGTPVDFVKWAKHQPDHEGRENCVQIFSDNSEWPAENGWYQEYNNYDCNEKVRAFVCKKAAIKS
uniref:C-type lectin domain-containing protein n=1 Tax=Panagrolaimus davidi TaxID=227884 RepID=A0A914R3K8_9BILA